MNNWRFKYELIDGVFTDCNPDGSKCTVTIKREGMRRKDTIGGTLDFCGAEYDVLYLLRSTKYQIKIKVYQNNTYLTSGYLRLFKGKFNSLNKTATLDIANDTDVYQTIEGNLEIPYDILQSKVVYDHNETSVITADGELDVKYYNYLDLPSFEAHPPTINGVDCSGNPPPTYSQTGGYALGDCVLLNTVIYKCKLAHTNPTIYAAQGYELGDEVINGNYIFVCKLTHTTAQTPKTTFNNDDYWYLKGTNNIGLGHTEPVCSSWDFTTSYNINDKVYVTYFGHKYYYNCEIAHSGQAPPPSILGSSYWSFYPIIVTLINIDETVQEQTYWSIYGKYNGDTTFPHLFWQPSEGHPPTPYGVGDKVEYIGGHYFECIKANLPEVDVNEPPEQALSNEWWTYLYPKVYYYTRYIYPIFGLVIPNMQVESGMFVYPDCTPITLTVNILQGCRFYDTIKYLVSQADSSLTVETDPLNANFVAPYLLNFSYLSNILVYDKSDVKYTGAGNSAPFEMITLKKYFEIIKGMFQLDWYIDTVGLVKYFKLRHPSENITTDIWIDLRNYEGYNFSRNIEGYSASATLSVKRYGIEFEKSSNLDFDSGYQEYDVLEDSDNMTQLSEVCNNVGLVYSLPENFSDFGLVFVACDALGNVLKTPRGFVNDIDYINAPLCASRLIYDHWNYSSIYPLCLINGVYEQTTNTAIGTYKTDKFDFPLTDIGLIDVTKLVKTNLSEKLGILGMYVNTITQKLDNDFADITLDF